MSLPLRKQNSIAPGYWLLSLKSAQIASVATPGQFVMLKIGKSFDPLLPRPMSIHSIIKEDNHRLGFTILYKVVGKGTRLLAEKRSGESLAIVGPLGTGFNLNHIASGYEPIVVGGGIGIAPLLFLAHELVEKGQTPTVFLGANSQEELLALDEFESLRLTPKVSTEDGSKGVKGMVTDLLASYLDDSKGSQGEIFACGPAPMLKKVASLAKSYGLKSQLSLEQRMACGLGACLGCVVK
ncbi:MAG: dihydroorotate dehydrogenase electron transfer subunit, partial [Candidatus Aminicenantes bacterium]|nr:dihydroorotate dehydrogenase electron transfer subunit [Candidatus Aminicenantes bacterium]